MKPDVVVTFANQTALFKTQNRQVSEWLRQRYHINSENVTDDTEIRVHPNRTKRIVEELKTAGFNVLPRNQQHDG